MDIFEILMTPPPPELSFLLLDLIRDTLKKTLCAKWPQTDSAPHTRYLLIIGLLLSFFGRISNEDLKNYEIEAISATLILYTGWPGPPVTHWILFVITPKHKLGWATLDNEKVFKKFYIFFVLANTFATFSKVHL